MIHQRAHAVERLALGNLRLKREPFVENERLHRVAPAERVERMFARGVRLERDRGERAEAFGHVVGVGELAVGELESLDHVAVDEQAEGDVAQRAAAGRGRVGAERRGIGEFGVQGGERAGVRAPERAAHGLARRVDRIRIDILADLARDVRLRRQAHRQRREGAIDAARARILDQRAEGGGEIPVALGRAAGPNGA